jgi:hypothetical protein
VQHLCDPTPLVVLNVHQPHRQRLHLRCRRLQLAFGGLSRRNVLIDDDGPDQGLVLVSDWDGKFRITFRVPSNASMSMSVLILGSPLMHARTEGHSSG